MIREAVGPEGMVRNDEVRMGFLLINAQTKDTVYRAGRCETYIVEEAEGVSIRYGSSGESLGEPELLEKYDVVLAGKGDVYQYEFRNEDSYVKLMYFIPDEVQM